jgi:hypothetical protein
MLGTPYPWATSSRWGIPDVGGSNPIINVDHPRLLDLISAQRAAPVAGLPVPRQLPCAKRQDLACQSGDAHPRQNQNRPGLTVEEAPRPS